MILLYDYQYIEYKMHDYNVIFGNWNKNKHFTFSNSSTELEW